MKIQENEQILGPCLKTEKTVEHEGQDNTNSSWSAMNSPQRSGEGSGRIRNQWENRNHPDYGIAEIG